ncbi:MAG: substrate-binding domain-containing protein, partial [Prochlorococcaceae cyanobacterium ETNP2_MAG_10]|nr:substrate-binding domain-containing protein [Prochlorococcaceae cyanobacterium ETNP2_MAG_10]
MTFSTKALLFASLMALSVGISSCSTSSSSGRLSGAGATFPAKIYTRWFSDLAQTGGPQVNYQAVGSGSGRKAFIDQTVNFAASDDPMQQEDIEKVKRGLVQIP